MIHSRYDSMGKLFVDCTECTRGKNGDETDYCAAGAGILDGGFFGCFCGELIPEKKAKLDAKQVNLVGGCLIV